MKRRSFLAMLGLAPAVAARPVNAGIAQEVVQAARIVNDRDPISAAAVTRTWVAPQFQALCDEARAAGELPPQPVRFQIVRVPRDEHHSGIEMQFLDEAGAVVMRQWAVR